MTFDSLLAHRCEVQRNRMDLSSGSAEMTWATVATNVPMFLDLNFLRKGKDPVWTPETGRASDRTGVAFFLPKAPLKNGDRLLMTKGPAIGSYFTLEMAIDEAWSPEENHHLEVFVKEQAPSTIEKPYNER